MRSLIFNDFMLTFHLLDSWYYSLNNDYDVILKGLYDKNHFEKTFNTSIVRLLFYHIIKTKSTFWSYSLMNTFNISECLLCLWVVQTRCLISSTSNRMQKSFLHLSIVKGKRRKQKHISELSICTWVYCFFLSFCLSFW